MSNIHSIGKDYIIKENDYVQTHTDLGKKAPAFRVFTRTKSTAFYFFIVHRLCSLRTYYRITLPCKYLQNRALHFHSKISPFARNDINEIIERDIS